MAAKTLSNYCKQLDQIQTMVCCNVLTCLTHVCYATTESFKTELLQRRAT